MYYVDHLIKANTLLKQMYEQTEEKNFLQAYSTGIQLSDEILEALKDINKNHLNHKMQGFYFARSGSWVGLADDEVSKIIDREIGFNSGWGPEEAFARAIESKLKEKNGG